MAQVSVVACPDYQPNTCRQALEAVLAPVGGLDFVASGMTVAIKVNLVAAMKPEAAATTHPALVCALTEMLLARGARVIIGDSPGGLFTPAVLSHVYRVTGMEQAEALGATLNGNTAIAQAKTPQAKAARQFSYTAWLDEADCIIDFCKLKSHGMMAMSAAAKNMFGVIPGTMKPEYHYKYPNEQDFSQMIVDLDEYFRPVLSICDAVVGMEGNGPTQGRPKQLGFLLAAQSPHALDLAAAFILGLKVSEVPTLSAAVARGLIPETAEALEVSGDLASFRPKSFEKIDQKHGLLFERTLKGPLQLLAKKVLQANPQVKAAECIGCGKCASICPAKAIAMIEKKPRIRRSACIHCFCCQEFCPKGAMEVRRSALARMITH